MGVFYAIILVIVVVAIIVGGAASGARGGGAGYFFAAFSGYNVAITAAVVALFMYFKSNAKSVSQPPYLPSTVMQQPNLN
jgi:hypothetical protein